MADMFLSESPFNVHGCRRGRAGERSVCSIASAGPRRSRATLGDFREISFEAGMIELRPRPIRSLASFCFDLG